MRTRIKDLRLRAVIGVYDWERKTKQEVVVNVEFESDGERAMRTDAIGDCVDYKALTKRLIREVEDSQFQTLEALTGHVLGLVLEDERIRSATVEVDKPGALRFARSVSITASGGR